MRAPVSGMAVKSFFPVFRAVSSHRQCDTGFAGPCSCGMRSYTSEDTFTQGDDQKPSEPSRSDARSPTVVWARGQLKDWGSGRSFGQMARVTTALRVCQGLSLRDAVRREHLAQDMLASVNRHSPDAAAPATVRSGQPTGCPAADLLTCGTLRPSLSLQDAVRREP